MKWQHLLDILKKKIHENQLLHVHEYVSVLQGPFFRLCIHCLSRLQNLFPRVCFWFFIQNRPCLSGTPSFPQSPKDFHALGTLQCSAMDDKLAFYQGKLIHQRKSVCLELSPPFPLLKDSAGAHLSCNFFPTSDSLNMYLHATVAVFKANYIVISFQKSNENPGPPNGST